MLNRFKFSAVVLALCVLVALPTRARAETEETATVWYKAADTALTGADAAAAKAEAACTYAVNTAKAASDWLGANGAGMDPQDEMAAWNYLFDAYNYGSAGDTSASDAADNYFRGGNSRGLGVTAFGEKKWNLAVEQFTDAQFWLNGSKTSYDDATTYYQASAVYSEAALAVIAKYTP